MQAESTPAAAKVDLPGMAVYMANTKAEGSTLTYDRTFVMANVFYTAKEYDKLKGFFDNVGTKDQEQAVLQLSAPRSGQ